MDLNMPHVDGFMATQRILSYQQAQIDKKMRHALHLGGNNDAPPAVIAAVTAYVNDDTINQCFQVGMVEVHGKPIDAKTLGNFVKKYYRYGDLPK